MTSRQVLFTSADGRVLCDGTGRPAVVAAEIDRARLVRVDASTWAARMSDAEEATWSQRGLTLRNSRPLLGDRRVAKALAVLAHRDAYHFDPRDGSKLEFASDGAVARGSSGRLIFPRIDPAVIGIVGLPGGDEILLARNRRHDYFSLIAGYVGTGESLEEAFIREVGEETGRRACDPTYWGSQPWPLGGSVMVGFSAWTTDREPALPTDDELAEVAWVTRDTLEHYPLSAKGSIARAMIDDWAAGKLTIGGQA
ncbi:NAD(+) diphosphatase [Corynebacterium uterequi]|uniref:NAD(+) diphosphatase n=1 Tax=Corynebacterium uterequi TaxID=1072256 RepID=A0A0G3HB58_9CORY|nr:NUDIX domain-containing protein [Corynebacterium uterequi]AKK10549.1 NUDIX family protein [Corynebacterium uterequi]